MLKQVLDFSLIPNSYILRSGVGMLWFGLVWLYAPIPLPIYPLNLHVFSLILFHRRRVTDWEMNEWWLDYWIGLGGWLGWWGGSEDIKWNEKKEKLYQHLFLIVAPLGTVPIFVNKKKREVNSIFNIFVPFFFSCFNFTSFLGC